MRYQRVIALLLLCLLPLLPLVGQAAEWPLVSLGSYPSLENGGEQPITWLLLKDDGEGVLLISQKVLDVQPANVGDTYIGYEYSTLKTWLEEDFLAAAFSPGEQALVELVTLPSVEELRKKDGGFFETDELRAKATPYAISKGVQRYSGGDASYWTRNRASSDPKGQRRVLDKGSFGYAIYSYNNIGVRPMIRLKAGSLLEASGRGSQEDPFLLQLPQIAELPLEEVLDSADQAAEQAAEQAVEGPGDQAGPMDTALLFTEGFPTLNAQGFLDEGQAPFIFEDEENGIWRYASSKLRIVITRVQDVSAKMRWFETHLFFPEGEGLKMYPFDENNRRRMSPMEKIADLHNLVYAMNGDYYVYRVYRDIETKGGVVIGRVARDGKVLYDQPINPKRSAYPPLDMMTLNAKGDMAVYDANEFTAKELVEMGARDLLSFGPILVRDGQINAQGVSKFGVTRQPRAGLGQIAEGHFLHIVAESRTSKSAGVTTAWLAEKFFAAGAHTAYNLDGGQTAVLIFLGNQLNEIGKYDNKTNARQQNEVMGIGVR